VSNQEDKREKPTQQETGEGSVRSQTIDLLVANVIPTTKYFESRFDFMQHQISELREGQKHLEATMNRRFEQVDTGIQDFKTSVDKRFEQMNAEIKELKGSVDKRFEQVNIEIKEFKGSVDKRFEQMNAEIKDFRGSADKRFDQMIASIDRLSDKLDRRDTEQRSFTIRMFTIAISISFLGVMGALLKIIGIL